jgi:glutamate-1-semialdehyde 2,1-aminomutase
MPVKQNTSLILNEGYEKNLYFTGGLGSKVFINKKKYLDLSFCSGTLILGHQSKAFRLAINKIKKENTSIIGLPNFQAQNLSKILKKIFPYYSKFIFTNSGSEAIFKSLRICKAVSKKNLIVACAGSWHGSSDKLLFNAKKNLEPESLSDGLSELDKKNIKFIPYNDIKKTKGILNKIKKKISCIIIEPIQGSLPIANVKDFLSYIEFFCKKNKIILIYDEVITGLRINCSSAQSYFKKNPDISIFGKCFGGGMPIGIIAINSKIYNKIRNNKKSIFFGGTFSANSITAHFGNVTTQYIYNNKKKIFKDLYKKSDFFTDELNIFIEKNKIDAKIYSFKSIIRIVFSKKNIFNRTQRDFLESKNKKIINKFKYFLFKKKIIYPSNGIIFFSDKTTYNDIKYMLKFIKRGLLKFFSK